MSLSSEVLLYSSLALFFGYFVFKFLYIFVSFEIKKMISKAGNRPSREDVDILELRNQALKSMNKDELNAVMDEIDKIEELQKSGVELKLAAKNLNRKTNILLAIVLGILTYGLYAAVSQVIILLGL